MSPPRERRREKSPSAGDAAPIAYVIPCYNEERRLAVDDVLRLASVPGVRVHLVDDGSKDGTRALLADIATRSGDPPRVSALAMPRNGGKGEAVRFGMRTAAGERIDPSSGDEVPAFVGFADADFATPVYELERLAELARRIDGAVDVVMGSRISKAGTRIARKPSRHYLGRGFSTAASLALGTPFYDTQCGAKLFRNTPLLRAALEQPFRSRWIFDVELLARLLGGVGQHPGLPFASFHEEPLEEWTDVAGSRIRMLELADVGTSLLAVAIELRTRGRGSR